ncbi:MAG: hypothetical protein M3O30_05900 [Planctomycetota bacterium]|nr:hypothetical protein [Planctomycetota bacterium]
MVPSSRNLLWLPPVPQFIERVRNELGADFGNRPLRVSRAPGRLDVMGGIGSYTGGMVCQSAVECAAVVGIQARQDRNIQVFSFNLLDEHVPFTLRVPLDSLNKYSIEALRSDLSAPGRQWAAYLVGCLAILHERGLIDLTDPSITGLNLALLSSVPIDAGLGSSTAIVVATMINLIEQMDIRPRMPAGSQRDYSMLIAGMCQEVETRVAGTDSALIDSITSGTAEEGMLLRMICQPNEQPAFVPLPVGTRIVCVDSNIKRVDSKLKYEKARCAAFMGHKMILEKMRQLGTASGQTLVSDPMKGYLANLDPDDYKRFFRPYLPPEISGASFLSTFGPIIEPTIIVQPDQLYHVLGATDHHVLEARRVRNFVGHLESASTLPRGSSQQKLALDKAGHLMYGSHLSYTRDALLGADECDLLVDLVRRHEPAGLYGARITGKGSGGAVAVLADISPSADAAIVKILAEYQAKTGYHPQAFASSGPGAFALGTQMTAEI